MKILAHRQASGPPPGPAKASGGRLKVAAVIIIIILVAIFAEVISYFNPTGTPQEPYTVTVFMPPGVAANNTLSFSPQTVTLVVGINNSIQWVNNDPTPNAVHTVTFTEVPANVSASALSSSTTPGIRYQIYYGPLLLNIPGVYKYHCYFHAWMTGTIVVKA